MAKKRPKVNLAQPIQPRSGDLEKLFATKEDVEQAAGLQLLAVRLEARRPAAQWTRTERVEENHDSAERNLGYGG